MLRAMIMVLLLLVSAMAEAAPLTPAKAKKMQGDFVTSFEECTARDNLSNPPMGFYACSGPVRSDAQCGFSARGSGKYKIQAAKSDLSVVADLRGLESGCEGEVLELTANLRVSFDDCAVTEDCTLEDLVDFPLGECVVRGGKCRIKSSLESELGAAEIIKLGRTWNVEIGSVHIDRDGLRTFVSGLRFGPKSRSCGSAACEAYAWSVSAWGVCSGPCGTDGTQARRVRCKLVGGGQVDDGMCSGRKPAETRPCANVPCRTYSWRSSGWGECSGTCGAAGEQVRSVWCQRDDGTHVGDGACSGVKPSSSQPCVAAANDCSHEYDWEIGDWSRQCDGRGQQTRTVTCRRDDGARAGDAKCAQPKPDVARPCPSYFPRTDTICAWQDVPSGWAIVRNTTDFDCWSSDNNAFAIADLSDAPAGYVLEVCNGDYRLPGGWWVEALLPRSATCPDGGKRIRRL